MINISKNQLLNTKRLLIPVILLFLGCGCKTPEFYGSVRTDAKPWTGTNFACAGKDDFHFALMGDRTGGARVGVFAEGLREVSLLSPEFVMSIGDYIEGVKTYSPRTPANEKLLIHQLKKFDDIVKKNCSVPFFRLPGNHDLTSAKAYDIWDKLYGTTYYWFIYRNVLFLCLSSCDQKDKPETPGLSEEQINWTIKVLEDNRNVRWTFVLMHNPLWLYDDNLPRHGTAKTHQEKLDTGFAKIEKALKSRKYTVFAGHTHAYRKYQRQNMEYYVLGLSGGYTGGVKFDRKKGVLDHFTWVSFMNSKPAVANVAIGGVMNDFWNEPSLYIEEK